MCIKSIMSASDHKTAMSINIGKHFYYTSWMLYNMQNGFQLSNGHYFMEFIVVMWN